MQRRHFLPLLGLAACSRRAARKAAMSPPPSTRTPGICAGARPPMTASGAHPWSRAFRALGTSLPKPKAILSVSAHWFLPGTFTTDNAQPETIHDFGGFPQALFDMQYPAPGDAGLARRVAQLVGSHRASP